MMILKSKLKTIRHIARIPLAVVAIVLFSGFIAGQAAGAPPAKQKFSVEITSTTGAFSGDFHGSAMSLPTKITKRASSFWFMDREINEVMFTLGDFFVDKTYPNGASGAECFMDGPSFNGNLRVLKEKSGSAKANFWFHGFADNDALTDILYTLRLTDADGWDVAFPPPALNDVAVMTATAWEMTSEGKGKLRKVVCVGAGGLGNPVVVTVTRIE